MSLQLEIVVGLTRSQGCGGGTLEAEEREGQRHGLGENEILIFGEQRGVAWAAWDVGGEAVKDKPGKENSLELGTLWMPSSATQTLRGRHWAPLRGSQHDLLNQFCDPRSLVIDV